MTAGTPVPARVGPWPLAGIYRSSEGPEPIALLSVIDGRAMVMFNDRRLALVPLGRIRIVEPDGHPVVEAVHRAGEAA